MNAKLAVWTSYYVDLSPEDAVLELKKWGINASELSDEHGLMLLKRGDPVEVGREFKKFVDEQEFTMTQGHLWLACKICSTEEAVYDLLKWIDLYDAIGIKNAVLHCDGIAAEKDLPAEEKYARNLAKLKIVEAHIKEKGLGIRVCLENLIGLFCTVDELNNLIDGLDDSCFGICLDTGHLNLRDKDQAGFIRKAGNRLGALHIADNEGEKDQHMMPYGKGNVKWDLVVKALREIGYSGLFNLEIPGERLAPLPVRGYKLEYIRKCYEYMMTIE
ncbi:MAG: sugar phosphate isomerase/epimerase [Ruminococcaceae bacterium]|nr:sugar phosphate isomerase/epimerase [Oscillospiraceae bacterium]